MDLELEIKLRTVYFKRLFLINGLVTRLSISINLWLVYSKLLDSKSHIF